MNSANLAAAVSATDNATAGTVTVSPQAINTTAQRLRTMPAATNPLYNPHMFASLPPEMKVAIHAAAPQVLSNAGPAARAKTMNLSDLEGIPGYEQGSLDPRSGLMRVPSARMEVVGSAVLNLTGVSSGVLKWTPQRDVKGVRLIIPSAEEVSDAVYLSNLLVGNRPIYLGSGNEPVENFSELSTGGLVDFPICRVGINISATLSATAAIASTNFYTAILGYVLDGKQPEPLKGFMRRMAIPPVAVLAGASTTYALNPQDAFKVRKLLVDQNIASSFIVTAALIGNENQLLSGDPIPAQAFSDRAQDVWLDWDRCRTGQQIFLTVQNISGSTANFQGSLAGDVDEGYQEQNR